mgnify:CR=1 FL=1
MKLKDFFYNIVHLEDNEWNIAQNLFKERSFKKGENLISEGKIENYINFIVEGTCRAFYIKNGIEYNYEIGLDYKSFDASSLDILDSGLLENPVLIPIQVIK